MASATEEPSPSTERGADGERCSPAPPGEALVEAESRHEAAVLVDREARQDGLPTRRAMEGAVVAEGRSSATTARSRDCRNREDHRRRRRTASAQTEHSRSSSRRLDDDLLGGDSAARSAIGVTMWRKRCRTIAHFQIVDDDGAEPPPEVPGPGYPSRGRRRLSTRKS